MTLAEQSRIRTALAGLRSFCVECGPDVRVDEDGCCRSCGNGAVGTWLYNALPPDCECHSADVATGQHGAYCPSRVS